MTAHHRQPVEQIRMGAHHQRLPRRLLPAGADAAGEEALPPKVLILVDVPGGEKGVVRAEDERVAVVLGNQLGVGAGVRLHRVKEGHRLLLGQTVGDGLVK